jgi:hypothetical protein
MSELTIQHMPTNCERCGKLAQWKYEVVTSRFGNGPRYPEVAGGFQRWICDHCIENLDDLLMDAIKYYRQSDTEESTQSIKPERPKRPLHIILTNPSVKFYVEDLESYATHLEQRLAKTERGKQL